MEFHVDFRQTSPFTFHLFAILEMTFVIFHSFGFV